MDEQLLRQLDRRIDEYHHCLCQRLDGLADALQTTHAALSVRIEAHDAYHRGHEHRWGLLKLAERYPFRLASLAFVMAWALVAGAPGSMHWLGDLVHRLAKLMLG